MKQKQDGKRRFSLRRSDKVILGVLSFMALILLVLTILKNNGLRLIQGEYELFLPMLMLLLVLGWGTYALFRRLASRGARMAVALVGALVIMLLLSRAMTYISYIVAVGIPQYYKEFKSPNGANTAVLMRVLDASDEHCKERMDERRQARLAEEAAQAAEAEGSAGTAETSGDDASEEEYVESDFGYVYMAYPKALLGLFYRADADVEGAVYETYGAEGRLKYEWLDGGSAFRLFISDPGPGEGGEWILRF